MPSFFVENRRIGNGRKNFFQKYEKNRLTSFHFNTNMLYYTKGVRKARLKNGGLPSGPFSHERSDLDEVHVRLQKGLPQ